jgi:O-antigen biosynthesis protein WbqP
MKRLFDLLLALSATSTLLIPIIITAILVKLTSKGSALYWSDRVGKDNQLFKMPKFRSMKIDTQAVATHLLEDPRSVLTPIGNFLRKSSLDELPQLWPINGRDELSIPQKVALDVEYVQKRSFWFDIKILWFTFLKVFRSDGVSH